jgi:hypothetical protein
MRNVLVVLALGLAAMQFDFAAVGEVVTYPLPVVLPWRPEFIKSEIYISIDENAEVIALDDLSDVPDSTVPGAAAHIADSLFRNDLARFTEFDIRGFPDSDFRNKQLFFFSDFRNQQENFRIGYWSRVGKAYVVGLECMAGLCLTDEGMPLGDFAVVLRESGGQYFHDFMHHRAYPQVLAYMRLMQARKSEPEKFSVVQLTPNLTEHQISLYEEREGIGQMTLHFNGAVPTWGKTLFKDGYVPGEPIEGTPPRYHEIIKFYRDLLYIFVNIPAEENFRTTPEFKGFLTYLESQERKIIEDWFLEADAEGLEFLQNEQKSATYIRFIIDADPVYAVIASDLESGIDEEFDVTLLLKEGDLLQVVDLAGTSESARIFMHQEVMKNLMEVVVAEEAKLE